MRSGYIVRMIDSASPTVKEEVLTAARSYLRIEPTTDPLDSVLVETTIPQLRALLSADGGFGSSDPDLTADETRCRVRNTRIKWLEIAIRRERTAFIPELKNSF